MFIDYGDNIIKICRFLLLLLLLLILLLLRSSLLLLLLLVIFFYSLYYLALFNTFLYILHSILQFFSHYLW